MQTHTHTHTHIHTHRQADRCAKHRQNKHTHTHTRARTHTHTHAHAHTHTLTHTHARARTHTHTFLKSANNEPIITLLLLHLFIHACVFFTQQTGKNALLCKRDRPNQKKLYLMFANSFFSILRSPFLPP
jgi:hypothetical protein